MIFSPIFHIELLTVGRRKRYFISRVIYASLLLTVMGFCYLAAFEPLRSHATLQDQAEFAFMYFIAFSWIQIITVLGLTPAMMAGTISVEHERKTIDYLLTTQLSDTEIALGKFAARLWSVIMQLAVGVPILAIGLMLGGVSPEQMFASFGVSFFVLLLTATLSLAISSRAARSREAITRTYLVIIALLAFPPLAWKLCEEMSYAKQDWPIVATVAGYLAEPLGWIVDYHPFNVLFQISQGKTSGPSMFSFGTFAGSYSIAAALLAISAVVGVRRFYLKQAGRSDGGSSSLFGRRREKLGGKRRPVGEQAMVWKEITSLRSAINLGWSGRIATALLFLMIVYFIGQAVFETVVNDDWRTGWRAGVSPMEEMAMVLVPLVFGLMLLLITSNAAGSITGEREKDTWITLISTPVEGREIVRAKIWATLYGVRYWYALILMTWILTACFRPTFVFIVPVIVAVHAGCALFTASLGVRCSLQATTSLKSMGLALAIIVLGVSIAPLIGMGFVAIAVRGQSEIMGLVAPTSLPFLFSAPHPLINSLFAEHHGERLFAFVLGCFLSLGAYTVAASLIYSQSVDLFDRYAGRSTWRSAGARHIAYGDHYSSGYEGGAQRVDPPAPRPPIKITSADVDILELVDEAEDGRGPVGAPQPEKT